MVLKEKRKPEMYVHTYHVRVGSETFRAEMMTVQKNPPRAVSFTDPALKIYGKDGHVMKLREKMLFLQTARPVIMRTGSRIAGERRKTQGQSQAQDIP